MVALLIGMSVAGILMSALMPVWKQMATREKEMELVYRGEQIRRAIGLFQRRNGPGALPPSIDALVEQKFLRKKYKDPITNDDFEPILQGQVSAGAAAPGGPPQAPGGAARGQQPSASTPSTGSTSSFRPLGTTAGSAFGGLMGVVSKSKAKSIRLYNGRNYYNEWQFIYTPQAAAPGGGAEQPGGAPGIGGRGGRDGRGGRGAGPDGRGVNPPGQRGQPPGRGFDGRGGSPFERGNSTFTPAQPPRRP
jgi:type II secretory pathway pseudopilin PulG